jgi:uncharacterized protein involved in exopolysaccharide biosynthesis
MTRHGTQETADLTVVRQALRVLWRWSLPIALVAAVAGAVTWYVEARSPRQFESRQTLLFRFGRDYFPVSPGEQRRNWGENVNVTLDAAIFTEMRLLSSHALFARTLDAVGPDVFESRPPSDGLAGSIASVMEGASPEEPADADGKALQERRLRAIVETFNIERAQGAAIVDVVARHPLYDVADLLAATHVDVYFDKRRELFDRDAEAFFDKQIAGGREEYDALLAEREALMRDFEVSDLDVALDVARQRLSRAEIALVLNPENSRGQGEAAAARGAVRRLNELRDLLIPMDGRIASAASNISTLEQERANWSLKRDFNEDVAPTVEVIDAISAFDRPIGLSPKLKIALGIVFGALLGSMAVLSVALFRTVIQQPEGPSGGSRVAEDK